MNLGPGHPAAVDAIPDPVHLVHADAADLCGGLLLGMHPKAAEKAGNMGEHRTGVTEPHQQIPVHGEAKRFVDGTTAAFPDVPAPEQGFLGHEVGPGQDPIDVLGQDPMPYLLILVVDQDAVTVHHVHVGMVGKVVSDAGQRARQQQVVGIQPGHDLAGCVGETQIDRVGLAVVGSGNPTGQPVPVTLQDHPRPVLRASVLEPVFQLGIALIEHTAQGPF